VRPGHYSFLSNIIKNVRVTRSLLLWSLRSHPYADGRVECKGDLNASRALILLEHNIKKCGRAIQSRSCVPSVATPYADGRVECKKSVSEDGALLVLAQYC